MRHYKNWIPIGIAFAIALLLMYNNAGLMAGMGYIIFVIAATATYILVFVPEDRWDDLFTFEIEEHEVGLPWWAIKSLPLHRRILYALTFSSTFRFYLYLFGFFALVAFLGR